MIDLQTYLENKLRDVISAWNEADIYAVSFFVHSNVAYEYKGYSNVTEFYVSYNTESDCADTGELSEKRWNYAFWRQNETPIIEADNENEGMKILYKIEVLLRVNSANQFLSSFTIWNIRGILSKPPKKPIQMEKQMYFLLRLRNLVYRLLGITKLILAFRQLYKIIAY